MLKTITIIVVVLIAALLVYAATRPDTFRVKRATNIKAPPEKIFALINDFHSWGSWSAYEQKDPAMKRTYSGAANGEGAVYEWEGDKNVGKGRMEIAETSPPSKVMIKLDFIKPFETHNIAEFTMEPKVIPRTSPGTCTDRRHSFRRSSVSLSIWTAWLARTSRPVLPT